MPKPTTRVSMTHIGNAGKSCLKKLVDTFVWKILSVLKMYHMPCIHNAISEF